MKVITQPTVTVISTTKFHPHPIYLLPPHDNDAENVIAIAGKVCYDSYGVDGRSVQAHVQGLIDQRHTSVVEHANVGLLIEGISRGLSHEFVRHRHFSYSQRSTRYTQEGDAAIVLDPFIADMYTRRLEHPINAREDAIVDNFLTDFTDALFRYNEVVDLLSQMDDHEKEIRGVLLDDKGFRKWVRGKARQLLPHGLETRMVVTGNFRAWREFLIKRTNRAAEEEMRRLAQLIYEYIKPLAPNVFDDFVHGYHIKGYLELRES